MKNKKVLTIAIARVLFRNINPSLQKNLRRITIITLSLVLLQKASIAQTGQWKLAGNSLTGNEKLGSTNNVPLDFITNNVKRISLTNAGNLRINSDQSSIQFPNPGPNPKPMMFLYESGVANTNRMVFAYSPGFTSYGLQYTLGDRLDFLGSGISAMTVDLARRSVGIGTTNTENFKLKIVHGNNLLNGLAIENSTSPGIEWSLFTGAGNSPLNFIRNGALLGQISFPTGQYLALSDERLKTNIRPMPSVLEKIKQLKPSTYQFKKATDKQDYDGFVAQDVMKIFPALVSHTTFKENDTDVYTMDYSGFGVIAIKGIQELLKLNEEKDARIDSLQLQIDELKMVVLQGAQHNAASIAKISTTLTDASLEQNIPNPFTNTTTIRYSIPHKFTTAQLVIHDINGKIIKQMKISDVGKGSISINATTLSAGTYTYSLIVDGKVLDSKQMVFNR